MKLLLWLSPLFSLADRSSDVQYEEIETVPRSERFPPHPPHEDLPCDYVAQAEADRASRYFIHM